MTTIIRANSYCPVCKGMILADCRHSTDEIRAAVRPIEVETKRKEQPVQDLNTSAERVQKTPEIEQPVDSWLVKQMLIACEGLEDLEDCMISALAVVKLYTRQPKREASNQLTKEEKMRKALLFIAGATEHDGKSGNEYRASLEIKINMMAKRALNYEPGDQK